MISGLVSSLLYVHPLRTAALTAVLALFIYGLRIGGRWKLRHLPGPRPSWLVGNFLEIFKSSLFVAYQDWRKKYGKIFAVQLGAAPVVVITDAEVGRSVNLRNLLRPMLEGPADILSDSNSCYSKANMLNTQSREYHRSLKNAWLPFFYSGSLDGYAGEMVACADVLVGRLSEAAAEKRTVNIWRMLGEMTMDVVGTCAFGVKFRTQEVDKANSKEAEDLIHAARSIFQLGTRASKWFFVYQLFPFVKPVVSPLATAFPDKDLCQIRDSRALLLQTSRKLLDAERARQAKDRSADKGATLAAKDKENVKPANGKAADTASAEEQVKAERRVGKGGFLQLMVNAKHKDGRPFTDVEIVQQAFTFLLAGYETTASTLGFCVYNLARYPDKMAKLCKEVDSIPKGHVPTVDELACSLPYVDAVFRESLRLYPVGLITIRKMQEDCNLLGYNIKKGTAVHVNWFGIHRDPEVWKDADEFVPERWIDGTPEAESRPSNAFFPFGDGNLVCVGMRFAQEEAKIALIRIFQNFTFKLAPGQIPLELASPITLGPKKGIFVIPERRT